MQDGSTCLQVACAAGHFDMVRYLCERSGEKFLMLKNKVNTFYEVYFYMPYDVSGGTFRQMQVLAVFCDYSTENKKSACINTWY